MVAAFEQYGRLEAATPEDRYRVQWGLQHEVSHHLRLSWDAGFENVVRFNFLPDNSRRNVMTGVTLEIL